MQLPDIRVFEARVESAFDNGQLRGDSPVQALPHFGPYLSGRVEQRLGADSVDSVLRRLAGLGSAAAVVGALTATLRNARARERIAVDASPVLGGARGGKVVGDVNAHAYNCMCALLRVAARMSGGDRAARARRRARRVTARVPANIVPPPYPRISLGAMHCGAHHDDREACRRAMPFCRWVHEEADEEEEDNKDEEEEEREDGAGAGGGAAQNCNCVPRSTATRSGPGLGANVGPHRRLSAQRRAQPPLVDDGPLPPLERWAGAPTAYVGGWYK